MKGTSAEALALLDVGSTYTKGFLIRRESGTIIARTQVPTTTNDISTGAGQVLAYIETQNTAVPWESVPKLVCSSAAGGLQMVAIGLVPDLTAKAAREAVLGAGARVQKCYSYELTAADLGEIKTKQPDIILLAGGTDGGSRTTLIQNAEKLAALSLGIPLILAGNRSASDEAADRLEGHYSVHICDNVMPAIGVLNVEPARRLIRDIFLNSIVRAKGLDRIEEYFGKVVMPTPAAVLEAGRQLQCLCGDIVIIDLGGATTDVHSICPGLPVKEGVVPRGLTEPLIKRSVEGDLGLRVSATALLESWSVAAWAHEAGTSTDLAQDWLNTIREDPGVIAEDGYQWALDRAMASFAVIQALSRHSGRLERVYTPAGAVWMQDGKDLSAVKRIVLSGGFHAFGSTDLSELRQTLQRMPPLQLLPRTPQILTDQAYVLAAVGLAAEQYPQTAKRMLQRYVLQELE